MEPDPNPYTTLGLNHTATLSTIKRTHRHLALLHHPDHNPNTPQAHQSFIRIQRAYEQLLHLHPPHPQDQAQATCIDPALDTYPIWYDDIPHPSFKYIQALLVHLRFDARDLWGRHVELLALLERQRKRQLQRQGQGEKGKDEFGYAYACGHVCGFRYEDYTNTTGQIISNLSTQSEVLERKCRDINGDAYTETSRWSSAGNMRKVSELQGELTTLLNSAGVMWKENLDVREYLEEKGDGSVSEKEWEELLEMLREMAHAPPV